MFVSESGAIEEIPCGEDSHVNVNMEPGDNYFDALACLCPDNVAQGRKKVGDKTIKFGGMLMGCPPKWGGNGMSYFDYIKQYRDECLAKGGTWTSVDTPCVVPSKPTPDTPRRQPREIPSKPTPDTPKVQPPTEFPITPPGGPPIVQKKGVPWWLWVLLAGGAVWFFTKRKN